MQNLKELLTNAKFKAEVKPIEIEGVGQFFVKRLSWGELRKQSKMEVTEQVCNVLCDEEGNLLFTKEESENLDHLPPQVVKQILDEATEFNSLDAKVKQAKNV
ncbi:MAG: hypothetical protein H6824_01230 [Planctomycetaceae bacterium]|nr:hypothetical protein [Planctomycetaceae bacterium]